MKNYTITVHALQHQPVGCMNAGELLEVKTCTIGGTERVYVSSQAWKKAMRDYIRAKYPNEKAGIRTRQLKPIADILQQKYGYSEDDAKAIGTHLFWAGIFSAKKYKTWQSVELEPSDEENKTYRWKIVMAVADDFFENIAECIARHAITMDSFTVDKKDNVVTTLSKDEVKKICEEVEKFFGDTSVDVQLFGRMVAGNDAGTVEGACAVAMAHSVSEASIDMDYFTAVDEGVILGSGMLGTREMTSGILYRYGQVSTGILSKTLGEGLDESVAHIVELFVESFIKSIPTSRKTQFGTVTAPYYVYVEVRDDMGISYDEAFVTALPQTATKKDVQNVFENTVKELQEYAITKPVKAFVCANSDLGEKVHADKVGAEVCQFLLSAV